MSKQDFVFTIDAHHFQVTSLRNNRRFYTPCAYVRPSTSNGKADFDKVLIFFEKSVANEFNKWMPGFLRQSQTSGRWYMPLRTEDIDCTSMGYFDHANQLADALSNINGGGWLLKTHERDYILKGLLDEVEVKDA